MRQAEDSQRTSASVERGHFNSVICGQTSSVLTRTIFQEIRNNNEAYRLLLSVTAKGEAQGGWENERLAAKTQDPELAAKIARHGVDEDKHARFYSALLKKRGLESIQIPACMDYIMLLTDADVGVPHDRLRSEQPATDLEIIQYLAHGRVTEQRGAEEIDRQLGIFKDDPELGRGLAMVANEEVNHLSHCHEELLKLAGKGHGETIRRLLKRYALVEVGVHRDVSLAFIDRLAYILHWARWKTALIRLGIHATYWVERAWTWRRFVSLRPPERRNALGEPACPGREATLRVP